jgi:hypothetical protein
MLPFLIFMAGASITNVMAGKVALDAVLEK